MFTCSNLDDESDCDADGEDEHGDDDDSESVDRTLAGSPATRKGRRLFGTWQSSLKVVIKVQNVLSLKYRPSTNEKNGILKENTPT